MISSALTDLQAEAPGCCPPYPIDVLVGVLILVETLPGGLGIFRRVRYIEIYKR